MSGATGPTRKPFSIPTPQQPISDPASGKITNAWFRFFEAGWVNGGSGQPQPTPAQLEAATADLARLTATETAPARGPDYSRQISDLQTLVAVGLARSAGDSGKSSVSGQKFAYTLAWGAGSIAQNGTIELEGDAQEKSHILGVKFDNGVGGGSITGAFQIGTTDITGLAAVVNNGAGTATATAANALPAGGALRVVLSGVSSIIADGGYFTTFGTYD